MEIVEIVNMDLESYNKIVKQEEIHVFSLSMKHISDNDYELITKCNPAFARLPEENFMAIQKIIEECFSQIRQVLRK